ncbi:MAG TPA: hypothetical protein VML55_01300 [Planctomycetaceae bacterium]|nr:hypothetical protein [Planctomycetaceae bacterium]
MTDSMFSPDPRLLDRMVDGELSPKDERALLVQLDDEPAGWRQLALAFVESRTWQREFALAARDRGTVVSRAGSSLERSSRAVRRFAADGPDQPAGGRDSA